MKNQLGLNKSISELIWDYSSDAIFAMNHQGAIIEANAAFKDMLGYDAEEIRDQNFPPTLVDMTVEEQGKLLDKLRQGHRFSYQVVKRKDKEGNVLDILASYWPVNDEKILAIGLYKDFTEQKRIQSKLEESEYYYRSLVEHLPEAIILQRHNKIRLANQAAYRFLGAKNKDEIHYQSIWRFVSSERKEEIQQMIEMAHRGAIGSAVKTMVAPFVLRNGKEVYAEVKVIPLGHQENPDIQIVFHDVTEKKRYETQLEYLAYHDPLTGLNNRRRFTEIGEEAMAQALKRGELLALLYLDIDDFKLINDTYGHDAGDQVLKSFAKRIQSNINEEDIACRIGGDEFLVLLKNRKEGKELKKAEQRLQAAFQKPYLLGDLRLYVTCSIGVAAISEGTKDLKAFIHEADKALYRKKDKKSERKP